MDDIQTEHEVKTRLENDKFFNLSRRPRTQPMHEIIAEIMLEIEAYETKHGTRKRKRKAEDRRVFELTVSAIICNLVHAALGDNKERGMAISRSNRTLASKGRYKTAAQNRQLPYVLDLLATPELGWLRQELGEKRDFTRNQLTLVWPTERVAKAIAKYKIDLSDICPSLEDEVIVLKSGKDDYWSKSKYVQYDDDADTIAYRAEVQAINRFIAQADIDFDEQYAEGSALVDTQDRILRRCFSRGSLTSGGRLFGGFWQGLRKTERLPGILINGEEVVGLDYGQIAIRILYSIAGAQPPAGDLYDIPGLTGQNGKCYRQGIKTIINSLMFSKGFPERKPKGSSKLLPRNLSMREICHLIKVAHPDIADWLGTDIGHRIQFIESTIMTKVLTKLMGDGIVALPIHDGLIVQTKYEGKAREVMEEVFEAVVRLPCPVTKEFIEEVVIYMGVGDWSGTCEAAV